MNNKLIKPVSLLLFLACFIQCNNSFLNTTPKNTYSDDDVWSSIEPIRFFLYNTYNSVNGLYAKETEGLWGGYATNDHWTPNMTIQYYSTIPNETFDKFTNLYWNQFDKIRMTNLLIQKVTESKGLSEKDKKTIVAEAKFLRAITYFWLARKFGGTIIIKKPLNINDNYKIPRSTIKETYDFVIKELTEVATELIDVDLGKGRASVGAARAFITDAALQAAAYTGDNSYFDTVITNSNAIYRLNKYTIDTDYGKLFRDPDYATASNEVIYGEFKKAAQNNTMYRTPLQVFIPLIDNDLISKSNLQPKLVGESFGGWLNFCPTQNLVDDYLVIDVNGDNTAKYWNQTATYNSFISGADYVSFMYKNRDKRFYASICYDSSAYSKQPVVYFREKGNFNKIGRNLHATLSGYLFLKHVPYDVGGLQYTTTLDFVSMFQRLSRVKLNHVEALLRKGKTATAIPILNETRTIHGELPELPTSTSVEDAWKFYKIERRVELVAENDYYWSLLRWGKYDGGDVINELNEDIMSIDIGKDGKTYSFSRVLGGNEKRKFTKKRYLFPIPDSQVQLGGISQNPGWE